MLKVLFISTAPRIYLNMGIMQLSSMLKSAGHSCKLAFSADKDLLEGIEAYSPGIIAISYSSFYARRTIQTIREIKRQFDIPIILGGPHPTYYPDIIDEEGMEIICRGEGEHALLEIVNKMEGGEDTTRIKNLWVKKDGKIFKNDLRPLVEDLDSLPFPDREIFKNVYKKLIL